MDPHPPSPAGNPPWPYVNMKILEKSDSIDRLWMEPQHQQSFPTFDHQNLYLPLTETSPYHDFSEIEHNIESNNGMQNHVSPLQPTPTLNIALEKYVDISSMSIDGPLRICNPAISLTTRSPSVDSNSLAAKSGQSRPGRVVSRKAKKQKFRQSCSRLPVAAFVCTVSSCRARFKRAEHVKRHMASHSGEKPYVCWVPGCNGRFSRHDNLQTHYYTHATRGGRNRYVATLDPFCSFYDPCFRGSLTAKGDPVYEYDPSLEVIS